MHPRMIGYCLVKQNSDLEIMSILNIVLQGAGHVTLSHPPEPSFMCVLFLMVTRNMSVCMLIIGNFHILYVLYYPTN